MKQKGKVTVRLDRDLRRRLDRVRGESRRSRSDVVWDALRRRLRLVEFEELQAKVMPFAESRGYLTDRDVAAEESF